MRRAREADPTFPAVAFVHPATQADGEGFFPGRWPTVPALADPDKALFGAFGLDRGSLLQLAGPKVWLAGLRAAASGHGVGLPKGDPLVLAGAFLVVGGRVTWEHRSAHTGDIVLAEAIPRP